MKMHHHMAPTTLRSATAVAAAVALLAAPAAADDLAELARLTQAEGEQYVTLRNTLLEKHPGPWDIPTAAAQSWEFGLAAYVLNQRLKEKEAFKTLDNEHPRSYRSIHGYGKLSRSQEANTAFLLEKMWKAPSEQEDQRWAVTPEKDREYAYNTLVQARRSKDVGETALWKSMWEKCQNGRLQYVALSYVCADPSPSVQPIIVEVLHSLDYESAPYSKSRCLAGLYHRNTEETADAIIGAMQILANAGETSDAVGALAANESARARRFVYEFILDNKNSETIRAETLAKCCGRPQPGDIQVINQFLSGEASVPVKTRALKSIGRNCPLDHVRPMFREILTESEDAELIAGAALALVNGYLLANEIDPAAAAEDTALFETVARRETLPDVTRIHIGGYVAKIREKQEFLSARPEKR